MRMTVVTVFDKAAAAYGRPSFVGAIGQAMRGFQDEVNRVADDNPMYRHPDDFELYHLGFFDDASGRFENVDPGPVFLTSGSNVKSIGGQNG